MQAKPREELTLQERVLLQCSYQLSRVDVAIRAQRIYQDRSGGLKFASERMNQFDRYLPSLGVDTQTRDCSSQRLYEIARRSEGSFLPKRIQRRWKRRDFVAAVQAVVNVYSNTIPQYFARIAALFQNRELWDELPESPPQEQQGPPDPMTVREGAMAEALRIIAENRQSPFLPSRIDHLQYISAHFECMNENIFVQAYSPEDFDLELGEDWIFWSDWWWAKHCLNQMYDLNFRVVYNEGIRNLHTTFPGLQASLAQRGCYNEIKWPADQENASETYVQIYEQRNVWSYAEIPWMMYRWAIENDCIRKFFYINAVADQMNIYGSPRIRGWLDLNKRRSDMEAVQEFQIPL